MKQIRSLGAGSIALAAALSVQAALADDVYPPGDVAATDASALPAAAATPEGNEHAGQNATPDGAALPVIPLAGEPPAAPPQAPAPRAGASIDEVLVTAQKRMGSVQDTPIAISALGSKDLEFRAVQGLADFKSQVPSLNYSKSTGAEIVTLRGVGTNFETGGADAAVAEHIDGVYQPRATSGLIGIRDAERIEVLRGPQGTLYGRNATGGVINVILKAPTDQLEGKLQAGYSSFDTRNLFGVVSGPLLSGILDARLSGEYDKSDGYFKSVALGQTLNGIEGFGGRLALRLFPGGDFTADLSLSYRKENGGGPLFTNLRPPDPELEAQFTIFPPTTLDPNCCGPTGFYENRTLLPPQQHKETTNAALTWSWNLGPATLKSISGYQDHSLFQIYSSEAVTRAIVRVDPRKDTSKTFSEELNLSGTFDAWHDIPVQWLVGGFYYREFPYDSAFDTHIDQAAAGLGLQALFAGDQRAESYAGFGDITASLTSSVRAFGGVRVSRDQKDMLQNVIFYSQGVRTPDIPDLGVASLPTSCTDNVVITRSGATSPRYGLQWDVASDFSLPGVDALMLYVQQQKGYKAGGTNYTGCGNTYQPEEVISTEVGAKSTWWGGTMRLNLAVFNNNYSNFQVFKTDGFRGVVANAPKASIKGAEVEIQALPFGRFDNAWSGLSLDVTTSFLNAQYKQYEDTDPTNPNAGPINLAGHQLNRAPDYTVNTGLQYEWPLLLGPVGNMRLRGEWFRTADVVFQPYGKDVDKQKGYSLVNAFIAFTDQADHAELRLFAKNITATEYLVYSVGNSWGSVTGVTGEPRTVGVELQYHF